MEFHVFLVVIFFPRLVLTPTGSMELYSLKDNTNKYIIIVTNNVFKVKRVGNVSGL